MQCRRTIGQAISLLAVVMTLAIAAQPASAHANLMRSEPAANAILDSAPSQIKLWFSETPELSFTRVQVYDQNAQKIEGIGPLQADLSDDKVLSAALPALSQGVFTVAWKAVSQGDGHVTAGSFAFVVGKDSLPAEGIHATLPGDVVAATSDPTPISVAVRWLSYLSLAMLIGGFAFAPLVFQPVLASVGRLQKNNGAPAGDVLPPGRSFSGDSGLLLALFLAWLLSVCALVAGIILQADAVGGNVGTIGTLLTDPHFGLLFWLRMAMLALIGGLLAYRRSRWWKAHLSDAWWWTGITFSLALALTISQGSHAAATSQPWISIVGDWLHLASMGVWLGGLVALLLTLLWLKRIATCSKAPLMACLIGRFSQVATICLVALGLTGAVQVVYEVGDLWNLLDTPYGVTLLLKTSLLAPLLGLAAINCFYIKRRMRAAINAPDSEKAMQPWQRLIRGTVLGEIVFVTAILMITGVLSSLAPSREAFGAGLVARAQAADMRLILTANPGSPGLNTFDVYLKDDLNRPVESIQKLALIFTMADQSMGATELVAQPAGDGDTGHYVAQGSSLSMVGTWHIELLVRREGQDDVRTTLTLPVEHSSTSPTSVSYLAP